jgi:hypothetical protein
MRNSLAQRYLMKAQEADMNANFANADGFIDGDLAFTGENFFRNADGAINEGSAMKSQPYIVDVTSTSGGATRNVDLFGSFQYLMASTFDADGSLKLGDIKIASGIPGTTYREMLFQFQNQPFSVGQTLVTSGSIGQVMEVLSVVTRDANGNSASKALIPVIDPYQQQSGSVSIKHPYRIDGYTKITIAQVNANSTVKFHFYPADNINLSRALGGQAVARTFADPNVTSAQTIKLKV